jgi:hypothetical protein
MSFGPEQMWPNAFCHTGEVCTVSSGQSKSFTYTWTINGGINVGLRKKYLSLNQISKREDGILDLLKAAVDVGMSYSWSDTYTYSSTTTYTSNAAADGCGYWTFVPYMVG